MSGPVTVGADRIRDAAAHLDLVPAMEAAFAQYSAGKALVPPVGELLFDDPPGEVHIKYGYVDGDEFYVVKIASGFARNVDLGFPASDGLMLVFRRATGQLAAVLHDGGLLTDLRTAAAGAVAAKHLARRQVKRIGIAGTGVQARLQLRYLAGVTTCRDVLLWGRRADAVQTCARDMANGGFAVITTTDVREIASDCDLIVTTTAARDPLILGTDLKPGAHVTAMGSDTPFKRELDAEALARADVVVADSISQCIERGEIAHALREGAIKREHLVELGAVVARTAPGRTSDDQITIADLTGVAVQDCAIAQAVWRAIGSATG
jgi:ornithine cyclodeaminase